VISPVIPMFVEPSILNSDGVNPFWENVRDPQQTKTRTENVR
jgi:hypothetical protein